MNARTPYWPLFRNELGIDHYPKVSWALGLGFGLALLLLASFMPLLILFKVSQGNLGTFFAAFGDLVGFALVWWLAMSGWLFAFALLPGISNPVQSVRAFEFMFTRAVDRRRLFRTRAVAIYLVMLGPLLLSVLVSAYMPQRALGPDDVSLPASTTLQQEQFSRASLENRPIEEKPIPQPALMLIPHGEVMLTAWIFCIGAYGLLLMQGYCALLARHVQHNPWLAGFAIAVPVLVASFFAPWIPRHYPHLYEESFLFFARNLMPLLAGLAALIPVVQLFSERRFRKLEIL